MYLNKSIFRANHLSTIYCLNVSTKVLSDNVRLSLGWGHDKLADVELPIRQTAVLDVIMISFFSILREFV